MVASLLVLLLAAEPSLGTPLIQDGYSIRPPQAFRTMRKELFHGTRVGAIAEDPATERRLSAALVDRDDDAAATILISWVEGSFSASPSARDAFQTAVANHFREELGQKLALETARVVDGAAPRVEVLGTLKQEDQVRRVLVAAYPGDARHVVIVISVPTARFEALKPDLDAALDTFRLEPGAPLISRGLAGALVGAALGALLVSLGLWRTRQKRRPGSAG